LTKNRDATTEIEAWIVSGYMDSVPGYISRGRRFLGLSDRELEDAWKEAFENSALNPRNRAMLETLTDFDSELFLRGIPAPFDRVKEAMASAEATMHSYQSKLTSEQREEFEESMRADFEAFVSRRNADKN
jgi:hypothetical protein